MEDEKATTCVTRRLSDEEIQAFFHKHQPNCPYCGAPMTPVYLDRQNLLHLSELKASLTNWVLGYSCTCTSKEQAYS